MGIDGGREHISEDITEEGKGMFKSRRELLGCVCVIKYIQV